MEYHSAFHLISDTINKTGVSCVLIGGFAVNYYKFSRQTADIDFLITEEDFNKIIQSICKINNSDLVENFVSGLDGSTSELEFGTFFFNSIKFELWSVHKNQINSNLKNFIETIQLILEVAEIKIEDYN